MDAGASERGLTHARTPEEERESTEVESLLTVSGRRDSAGRPNSWTTRKITKRREFN